jgi:hypothetical protein
VAGFSLPTILATSKLPHVQITELLRASLEDDGLDAVAFCQYFSEWKALGSAGEYSDEYFGKDGEYARPKRNNQNVLRHVHLPPESDPADLAKWNRDHTRRSRKVSDTSLIYAQDPRHGILLIYIAREPEGHTLAEMDTEESAKLMNDFCDVAEAFMHDGTVLI